MGSAHKKTLRVGRTTFNHFAWQNQDLEKTIWWFYAIVVHSIFQTNELKNISNQKQDVSQQQLTCFIRFPLTSVATKSTLFHGDLRPTQTPTNRSETIELTQATVNAWVHHKSYTSRIQWFNHLDRGLPSMSPSQNTGKSDFPYFFFKAPGADLEQIPYERTSI